MKGNRAIAVLMTCYNRVETTLRCLHSLFNQTITRSPNHPISFDVWLVDDASPDGTGAKVRAAFPEVHVIEGAGGLFWCRGMRLAWDSACKSGAEYDFYLWLNDDVMLKEDAIETLLAEYERTKGVVVGKMSSDERETDVSFGFGGPSGDWMNGNLVLIPRAVFAAIGPIADCYRHAYGDHDYGLMAKKAGFALSLTSAFCGICPQQPERYHWLRDHSLVGRFKLLGDPKGYNLHDAVLFRYRNWGVGMAVVCFCHMLARAVLNWNE